MAPPETPATVFPFIVRHVNLLGIDSVELPLPQKAEIWNKLAEPWKLDGLDALAVPLTLDTLSDAIDRILAGGMVGRGQASRSSRAPSPKSPSHRPRVCGGWLPISTAFGTTT